MPHVDGVTHRDVEAAGIRFHVAEAGEGEPVVLLHGWPQNWYCWRKVMPLLAPERRVICPDMRGFGWSDAPPGRYDKQTMADDLIALLDALELERVDLIAHDWGAWAGFIACLDHPERIRRYLALNMYAPWPPPPSPARPARRVAALVPGGARDAGARRRAHPPHRLHQARDHHGSGPVRRAGPRRTSSRSRPCCASPRGLARRCASTGPSCCARWRRTWRAATAAAA